MPSSRRIALLLALILLGLLPPAAGYTHTRLPRTSAQDVAPAGQILHVGPGQMYTIPSQAALVAQDGDTIDIDAGTYLNDSAIWQANNLIIRGVGGMAHISSSGLIPNGKAIWVISGQNTTIDHIEFSGARVAVQNGAGIRQEGAGLTVSQCYFHDNEEGILAGDNSSSDIVIEYSEFANNGFGDGYTHNMYINKVRTFTLRYSYSHHADVGHTVKSRAFENRILYNRIMDEASGTASYTIDLPNGGRSYLIGNVLQQGPNTQNPGIISYGAEGGNNPDQHLYVVNNTIVNDRSNGGTFIKVVGSVPALVENNIFVGAGTPYDGPGTSNLTNNLVTSDAGLADRASFDYRLVAGSAAIDAGTDPGSINGVSLAPAYEYVHPRDKQDRMIVGILDIGAYEYAPSATEPPAAPSALSAIAKSFAQIDLAWADTASNETGFKIERRMGTSGVYVQIAVVGTNAVAFSDRFGLKPTTQYFYRVRATNVKGDSGYSNETSATTLVGIQRFVPLLKR
ncbi:MAG: right-handed parallel beta-helix repeat-containing protein [Roseiflexaceae bacterium]